jgi:membrane protease YdiL (CAAX protease family)
MAAGMIAGIIAFRARRDVINVSAAFDLGRVDFRSAFINFVYIAAIAVPTGLAIGFIQLAFDIPALTPALMSVATIFLFNALPEEILFRGIIQHSLERRVESRTLALLAAALIFGAAHLNNGVAPNYKYFLMASIAGVFYGRAWRARRNVLTSTLTHTLVNAGWNLFFR